MAALRYKVKGIALLESLLATVLLSLCFGIALSVLNSMNEEQGGNLKLRAALALKTEATSCKINGQLFDENIPGNEFSIERRIITDAENEHLAQLELKAITTDGKVLSEYYELVFIP